MLSIESEYLRYKKIIKSSLKKNIPEALGVFICGGYGRGEGAWYLEGKILKPYNDFDILVVVEKKINDKKVAILKEILFKEIEIDAIDVDVVTRQNLSTLRSSINNFDLKYASDAIFGEYLLEEMPDYDGRLLPSREVFILFSTRLFTLLGCLPVNGFDRQLTTHELRYFQYQMAKSVLAGVDAWLIRRGLYVSSYKRRVDLFLRKNEVKPNIKSLVLWSLSMKLNPEPDLLTPIQVSIIYDEVNNFFIREMESGLSWHFKKPISEYSSLRYAILKNPYEVSKICYSSIFHSSSVYLNRYRLIMAQFLLASAWSIKGIDLDLVQKAHSLMLKVDGALVVESDDWNELRKLACKLRMDFF